jgi:hypothetical protein
MRLAAGRMSWCINDASRWTGGVLRQSASGSPSELRVPSKRASHRNGGVRRRQNVWRWSGDVWRWSVTWRIAAATSA